MQGSNEHDAWILQMVDLRRAKTYEEWRNWDFLRNLEDADFSEIETAYLRQMH